MTMEEVAPRGRKLDDFAILAAQVRAAGLLEKCRGYYAVKIASTVLLFAAGWVAFFLIGASWLNLITATYLAVMSTQVALLGHDAGHKQIFRRSPANTRASLLLGNLLIGLSTGWWADKHGRHHDDPNVMGLDPDVATGALVHTEGEAADRGPFGRFLSRKQAYLFFPLLTLEGFHLHAVSVVAMFGPTVKPKSMRMKESFLLLMHFSLYLAAVFTVLAPVQAAAFIMVNQGLWGLYMGLAFAPNHKGMPVLQEGDEEDRLRKQVLTSRNIRGGRLTDWLLGCLNYQIEHHLFPSAPRSALPLLKPLVKKFCEEHNVIYTETGFFRSFALVLHHLRSVGANV